MSNVSEHHQILSAIQQLRQEVEKGRQEMRNEFQAGLQELYQQMFKEFQAGRQGLCQEFHQELGGIKKEFHEELGGIKQRLVGIEKAIVRDGPWRYRYPGGIKDELQDIRRLCVFPILMRMSLTHSLNSQQLLPMRLHNSSANMLTPLRYPPETPTGGLPATRRDFLDLTGKWSNTVSESEHC